MVLRQAYIAHWVLYMDHLVGHTLEATIYMKIEKYMKWYGKITHKRLHQPRHEGNLDTTYELRVVYNQHHFINMVSKYHHLIFFGIYTY